MTKLLYAIPALALAAACSSPAPDTMAPPAEESAATESGVPADIAAAAMAEVPGLTIIRGEAGNNDYEVTGTRPDGVEVELDMEQENGTWRVMEIQRDVPWSSVPDQVRAAVEAEPNAFEPVRVIESEQAADGSIVYELFAPAGADGAPTGGPAMEVRWHDGQAEVLPEG